MTWDELIVGDADPASLDCMVVSKTSGKMCSRPPHGQGQHVATDGQIVLETWES